MEEQFVKGVRMHLDHLLSQSKQLSGNREVALAQTNIQRGSMWLGLVLGKIGAKNPYPQSTDPSSSVIEERADQAKDSPAMFEGMPYSTRTESVKWLRLKLQNIIDDIERKSEYTNELSTAVNALVEAKMWWGQELNNIRTSGDGNQRNG
jgi:hypothetical protein